MGLQKDADYYNKRIATLKAVYASECERAQNLEKAVSLSKAEVEESLRRHGENEQEREKQRRYVESLEEGMREREEHVGELKRKINEVRRELQETDINTQALRQQVTRAQLRARKLDELNKARAGGGDVDTHNRQLALLTAIRYTNQRIKELEGETLGALHQDLDGQNNRAAQQRKTNQLLREENEKTKFSINEEMEQQRKYIDGIVTKIEGTREEIVQLEAACAELEAAPKTIALSTEVLEGAVQHLKDQIMQTERDRAAIEEEKKTLVQRIMRSSDPDAKMWECMMLLKSAVINLWKDYQTIGQVREKILKRPDQEAVFKEAHNAIKTAIRSIERPRGKASAEEVAVKGVRKDAIKWNVSERDIERLDGHKVRVIFKSLQEMVIAWDVMPNDRKAKMSTCEEVVANSLLLYALARHTLTVQNRSLMEKRIQLDQNESRLTKKGAYVLPKDAEGNVIVPSPQRTTARPKAATPQALPHNPRDSARRAQEPTPVPYAGSEVSPGSFL
eukprot:TRINITY_DN30209_c0_g1_i1.p2 TRINITY_DN30209_c0_g1~~TRINITY_DN30209_c0_g1_i1.p2  ORF type:complete len:507 (+),score=254.85 TRINITY_DN30209_c0_g1_i1:105-1625(+)